MAVVKNPWSDWFNYAFTYFPTTNWQHAFSPTINFGGNVEDAPVEQHVVDVVGSYGFQLNRVLDAISVIVDHPNLSGLSDAEKEKLKAFKELAKAADDAAKQYEGQVTEKGVGKFINDMRALKQSDADLYSKFKDEILKNI
jgi:uncharacterized protein YpuA (DUF1002 family)